MLRVARILGAKGCQGGVMVGRLQGNGGAMVGELAYILHIILRRFRFLLSLSQEASKTKHAPV